MSTLSLAEIVNETCKLKSKQDKVEHLKKHNSRPLRDILKIMYDTNLELLLPKTAPPYTPSEIPESHGLLYREVRKLPYFVKGFKGDGLNPYRREALFIQMLEAIDKEDAELMCKVIAQKPLKGLPVSVINEAFPGLIPENVKEVAEATEEKPKRKRGRPRKVKEEQS